MSKTAAASVKKAGAVKQPKKAAPQSGKETDSRANSALKWQLGGLIAGIVVALVSTTEPGQQVKVTEKNYLG